jgi:hypothetical protein
MRSAEEITTDLQDRLNRLKFLRQQALERHISHYNRAKKEKGADDTNYNIYLHLKIIYDMIEDIIETINSMNTAMLNLPDTQQFKPVKSKLSRISKKKGRAPTRKQIQEYEERDKRGRVVYK